MRLTLTAAPAGARGDFAARRADPDAALLRREVLRGRRLHARAVSDLERGLSAAPQRDTLGRLVGALDLDADERRGLESLAEPVPRRPGPAGRRAAGRRTHHLPAPLTRFV